MDNSFLTDKSRQITEEELIPDEEKRGMFLYILGTIGGILIFLGVAVFGVLYFF